MCVCVCARARACVCAHAWTCKYLLQLFLYSSVGTTYIPGKYLVMALFVIASELLIILQPNFVCWYIIVSWNFLSKEWIVVFKVSVKFLLISLLRTSSTGR